MFIKKCNQKEIVEKQTHKGRVEIKVSLGISFTDLKRVEIKKGEVEVEEIQKRKGKELSRRIESGLESDGTGEPMIGIV